MDVDYADNVEIRKSLSRFVYILFDTSFRWRVNQQHAVALSTPQEEYITLIEVVKEAMWLKEMISEWGFSQECVKIHCSSQSVTQLANHQMYHKLTKHVDIRLTFVN